MARKKKSTATRKRRVMTSFKRKARRVGTAFKPLNHAFMGAVYGFGRAQADGLVRQHISSKIPGGDYADELAFSGISYLLATKGTKVMGVNLRDIGKAGLQVEGALIGNQIGKNMMSGVTNPVGSGGYPV